MPVATLQGRSTARRYGQHCPIARAAELLTEPWTLLVIRECLRGSETPADVARGVSGMSATMLTARLRTLVHIGLVSRDDRTRGEPRYRPTDAGRELAPILHQLGQWGRQWLPRPGFDDLNPGLLLLDIVSEMDRTLLPTRRTVLHIRFADGPSPRDWWLILSQDAAEASSHRPAGAAAMRIDGTTSALVDVWLGHRDWLAAVRDGDIRFTGDRETAHAVLRWIRTSQFAHK
jgi:DNA-binding HxlR family transcriptional regulator